MAYKEAAGGLPPPRAGSSASQYSEMDEDEVEESRTNPGHAVLLTNYYQPIIILTLFY